MPGQYVVLDNGRLVLEKWTGDVSHADILQLDRRVLRDKRIMARASVLVDATTARFETPPEKIREIAAVQTESGKRSPLSRVALLVNYDAFGFSQLLAKEMERYGITVIVFHTLDIACTWLGLDAGHVRAQLDAITSYRAKGDRSAAR